MNTVSPERVGFSPERLKRVDQTMQRYVDEGKIGGIINLVARRGQVGPFAKSGWMDVEAQKEMSFDALFRVYSMTKAVTSAAVMILYEQGRFLLTDPVSKYIPEFEDVKYRPKEGGGIEIAPELDTCRVGPPTRCPQGGGGLIATIGDWYRLCHMLSNKGDWTASGCWAVRRWS